MINPSPSIVVIGSNSQLGQTLRRIVPDWRYLSRDDLDLSQPHQIKNYFSNKPDIIINFAAYTAVDRAEEHRVEAMSLNATAVAELSKVCKNLIHISTDYVFSGTKNTPYSEDDLTKPVNYYGETKLAGERLALELNSHPIILRTSWLYSEFNMNFVKRILELSRERGHLKIVYDQVGTPTATRDLAVVVKTISENPQQIPRGIYHFSDEGVCSWYDVAIATCRLGKIPTKISPILSSEYPTPAKRPAYSVLDKSKIKSALGCEIPHWTDSLEKSLREIQSK